MIELRRRRARLSWQAGPARHARRETLSIGRSDMKRSLLLVLLCSTALVWACDPDEAAPSPFARADELLQARDYRGASTELERVRAEIGDDPELCLRLGVAYEYLDDPAKAVIVYKDGLEAHPDAGKLWVALGRMYLQLEQYDRAAEVLAKGRALGVEDRFTALSLGQALGQQGELEAAEAEFERARAAGGDASVIDYHTAVIRLEQGRPREAVDLLEAVVKAAPGRPEALRELGNALLAADPGTPATVDRVLRMAWQVVDATPEDWRAHMLLGDAFMAGKDHEAAVEAYTDALRFGKNPKIVEERYVEAARALKAQEQAQEQGQEEQEQEGK
jgi:tetratricopeptide (TPR) repeat protein